MRSNKFPARCTCCGRSFVSQLDAVGYYAELNVFKAERMPMIREKNAIKEKAQSILNAETDAILERYQLKRYEFFRGR